MRDRLERVRSYATTRLVSTALVLLATPIALAVPAAAGSPLLTRAEPTGNVTEYHLAGNDLVHHGSSADALARGASTTGAFDGGRREFTFSTTPSRAAGNAAPNTVFMTLGAGSRLFGSHVPAPPVDGSSLSGSSGLTGVLTLTSAGTVAAAGGGQPPLPPYGRRTTWTFRKPSTRPG